MPWSPRVSCVSTSAQTVRQSALHVNLNLPQTPEGTPHAGLAWRDPGLRIECRLRPQYQFLRPALRTPRRSGDERHTLLVNLVNHHDIDIESDTPLLWVLRDTLGLTPEQNSAAVSAPRGACTVHVDGIATRSCTLAMKIASGKSITTIEGLARAGGRRLQEAWLLEDVAQCGYCQAGQLMSAAGLLAHNAEPSDAQIDAAMAGNICRCGTYQRIRRAIRRTARSS